MGEQRKPMANYYNSWKFTGKELDGLSREAERFGKETGLYYFGARYYQPSWSILALSQVEGWLSVDPLAEEMPEWTPYHYVFNNPLNLVDPDGKKPNDGWPPKFGFIGGITYDFEDLTFNAGPVINDFNLNAIYNVNSNNLSVNVQYKNRSKPQIGAGGIDTFVKSDLNVNTQFDFGESNFTFGLNLNLDSYVKSNMNDYGNISIQNEKNSFKDFDKLFSSKTNLMSTNFDSGISLLQIAEYSPDFNFDETQYSGTSSPVYNFIDSSDNVNTFNHVELSGDIRIDLERINNAQNNNN